MNYIIITPCYNEEKYIGKTIDSVLSQEIIPHKWVIVDDGSIDHTGQIIQKKIKNCPWAEYVYRNRVSGQTYYASNVFAIKEGLRCIEDVEFDYIAILDADIVLPYNYYQQVLQYFTQDPKLGIVSGIYLMRDGKNLNSVLNDRRSCPKNIMVFKRACYDAIGGFIPMKYGGEDTCACFAARMQGWKTWSYSDLVVEHSKPIGSGHTGNLLKIRFRHGIGEYFMGFSPLFQFIKSIRRCIKEQPFLIGGMARIVGFIYAHFMKEQRQLSPELIKFIRKEQLYRLVRRNHIPLEYIPNNLLPNYSISKKSIIRWLF